MKIYDHNVDVQYTNGSRIFADIIFRLTGADSVIDIGCGIGSMLGLFKQNGCEVFGVDGPWVDRHFLDQNISIDSEFVAVDLANQVFKPTKRYDLALCLEVAEHLPDHVASQLVQTLCECSDTVVFSCAVPGQGGQNHINEQWPPYWISKFRVNGYVIQDFIRPAIWANSSIPFWYRQNTFVFTKLNQRENISFPLTTIHPDLYREKLRQINKTRFGGRNPLKYLWWFGKSILRIVKFW